MGPKKGIPGKARKDRMERSGSGHSRRGRSWKRMLSPSWKEQSWINQRQQKRRNTHASSKAKHQEGSREDKLAEQLAERKIALRDEIRGNTRVATDPFLKTDRVWVGGVISGLKRKREKDEPPDLAHEQMNDRNEALGLVGYD